MNYEGNKMRYWRETVDVVESKYGAVAVAVATFELEFWLNLS